MLFAYIKLVFFSHHVSIIHHDKNQSLFVSKYARMFKGHDLSYILTIQALLNTSVKMRKYKLKECLLTKSTEKYKTRTFFEAPNLFTVCTH